MPNTDFDTVTPGDLERLDAETRDTLHYGVVGFDRATICDVYNATEARMAGLDPAQVLGLPFFEAVAQCMNNYLVAQRFADEAELDSVIPYVLTLRMRPTPVSLRLLATAGVERRYLLIRR